MRHECAAEPWFCRGVARAALNALRRRRGRTGETWFPPCQAAQLGISAETVQSHVHNSMSKLEADTRTQPVATALRQRLIA
jgi:DNA-directed RNA polymerase specialized sigma24 family protein